MIYDVSCAMEHFALIQLTDVEYYHLIPTFDSLASTWSLPAARLVKEDEKVQIGNFAYLAPGILVCDDIAKAILQKSLSSMTEFLPLKIVPRYWVVNILNVINCLNIEESLIEYFPSTGRVMYVKEFSFHAAALLTDMLVFKIPQLTTYVFATEVFKKLVTSHQLTGIRFTQVFP